MITINKKFSGLVLLLLFTAHTSFATIYKTVKNGGFDKSSTWTPSKPNMTWGFTDTVYIEHKVSLKNSVSIFGHFEVKPGGEISSNKKQLSVKGNASLTNNGTIKVKTIVGSWNHGIITNNGLLNIKSSLSSSNGTFINNGVMNLKSHFTNYYSGIFINNGELNVDGNITNRNQFSGSGDINTKGNLFNDWACIFNVTGDIDIDGTFTNKGSATFGGNIDIDGDVINNWASTLVFNDTVSINGNFSNKGPLTVNSTISMEDFTSEANTTFNGATSIDGDFTNKDNITNSGNLSVTGDYTNNWGNNLSNSGTINIDGNTSNKGDITNDGIIVIGGDLSNEDYIDIANGSVFYVKGSVDNTSDIDNNGNFYVDDVVTGTGDIDGAGTICNSDGSTDPTGGAKANNINCDICSGAPNTLPVQLISFNAYQSNSNITISWTTANEENNDYFEVLRSVDGKNFEVIAEVAGAGNSNITLDYSITDTDVDNNTYYYMLKQTDYDSKFATSEMIVVNLSSELNTKVYPNPISQGETLNIEFESLNNNQISIYDINGRNIKTINTNTINETIDITELAPGIYMLQIQSGTQVKVEKLVVK